VTNRSLPVIMNCQTLPMLQRVIPKVFTIILLLATIFFAEAGSFNTFLQSHIPKAYASNASIEQEIDITNGAFNAGGTNTGVILIDTTHYSNATYYFEVDALVSSGSGTVTFTYNAGSTAIPSGGSTIVISSISATATTQYRSAAFTPTGIQNAYMSATTGTGIAARARLIVVQTSPSTITNTVTQLDVGGTSFNDSTTSTTYVPLQDPKGWTYNASKYDGTVSAYFEATIEAASTKTVTAALFPFGTNCGTAVTNSAVTSDTSGSYQRVRSSELSGNLTTGTTYMACIETVSGATGFILNAHLVIQQTATNGITKVEIQHESMDQNDMVSSSSYNREFAPILYEPANWANGTFTYYFEAAFSVSTGMGYVELYNVTDSAAIASSPVSTSSSIVTLQRSAAITMPGGTKTLDTYTEAVGGGTIAIQGAWLIIDVTGLPQLTNTAVEQQINVMSDTGGSTATEGSVVVIDTTQYITPVTYYLEADALVTSGTGTITLTYNAGSAAIPSGGSTISVSITGTSMARYRSAAFTPTGTQDAYITTLSGTGLSVNSVKIIVAQFATTAISLTSQQTQIEMGNYSNVAVTSFITLAGGPIYWQWNSTKYTNITHVYFEVSATGGGANTLTAGLYTAGASCSTQVTGSQIVTASNTQQRVRSGDLLANLTNNTTYMVCIKSSSTGSGGTNLEGAKLIINQSSPQGISNMELQEMLVPNTLTNSTTTYTSENVFNNYTSTEFAGGTFTYEYGATFDTAAGTGFTQLYNNTATSAIASSAISTASTTPVLITSSSISLPSVASDMDAQIKNSATNATSVTSSWIEVDITGLPTGAISTTSTSIAVGNASPGTASTNTISFTPADTVDSVATILLAYTITPRGNTSPSGLSMSATPTITVSNNGSSLPNTSAFISTTGLVVITITTPIALSASGTAVVITIPSVTNSSSTGGFFMQIGTVGSTNTLFDFGIAANQVNANIGVQAEVYPILAFTVIGLTAGGGATGACGTTTTGMDQNCTDSSSATSLTFSNPSAANTNSATQEITTSTNAPSGYTLSLQETQLLTSVENGSNTIANVGASTTWTLNTTQGFGVNVVNATNGDTYSTNFSSNTKYQPMPINATTLTIASAAGVTASAGDSEFVNFQVGISSNTIAGNYTNGLNYVVLATF